MYTLAKPSTSMHFRLLEWASRFRMVYGFGVIRKKKIDQETDVPSSSVLSSSALEDVILGLTNLKSEFFAFREEVCGEFRALHVVMTKSLIQFLLACLVL